MPECQVTQRGGMTELENRRFSDALRVIDSGKDHQRMLKLKRENGLRNRLLTTSTRLSIKYLLMTVGETATYREKRGQERENSSTESRQPWVPTLDRSLHPQILTAGTFVRIQNNMVPPQMSIGTLF